VICVISLMTMDR